MVRRSAFRMGRMRRARVQGPGFRVQDSMGGAFPGVLRLRLMRGWLLCAAVACAAGGCLTLGGRTTYVQPSAETEARIVSLETRVQALEHAISTLSAPSPQYLPGEPIPSQPDYSRPAPGAQSSGLPAGR